MDECLICDNLKSSDEHFCNECKQDMEFIAQRYFDMNSCFREPEQYVFDFEVEE